MVSLELFLYWKTSCPFVLYYLHIKLGIDSIIATIILPYTFVKLSLLLSVYVLNLILVCQSAISKHLEMEQPDKLIRQAYLNYLNFGCLAFLLPSE